MNVKTRNGLFANEGYGGGVFNGNTAFGSYGDMQARSVTGLGRSLDNDDSAYPYNEFSMATQVLQSQINEQFRTPPIRPDICPIVVDGFLGGTTCGALNWLNWELPAACDEHKNMWQNPSFGTCPFIGYQTGDPCSAVNTIKTVQQAIGVKPDGVWGTKSAEALAKTGQSYCHFVPSCTGEFPPGVTCPGQDDQIHVPSPEVKPAPIVVPPKPEPELPPEPKPKTTNMGAFLVGGLVLAGLAAVVLNSSKKRSR